MSKNRNRTSKTVAANEAAAAAAESSDTAIAAFIRENDAHELYGNTTPIDVQNSNGIVISGQDITYGSSKLLINADFNFAAGKIYGIVARNGLGKSALLHRLNHAKIKTSKLLVKQEQELENQDMNAYDAVISLNVELLDMKKRNAELESMGDALYENEELTEEYNSIQERMDEYGKERSEVMKILAGMGFTDEHLSKKVSQLSGGWRKRVVLAAALYRRPNFLMLDEPTNHLDLEAVLWFENELKRLYKNQPNQQKTLIVISHNAEFMESLTETVLTLKERMEEEVERRKARGSQDYSMKLKASNNSVYKGRQVIVTIEKSKLFYYAMSYLDFLEMRSIRELEGQSKGDYEKVAVIFNKAMKGEPISQRDLIAADMNTENFEINFELFVATTKISNGYTREVHKKFMLLYNSNIPKTPVFPLMEPDESRTINNMNGVVLKVHHLSFEYKKDDPILKEFNFEISLGEVYCVCGPNGSGKSTFFNLIARKAVAPEVKINGMSGLIEITPGTKVGYYSQYASEQVPPETTILEYVKGISEKYDIRMKRDDVYELMSHFAIPSNVLDIPFKLLSGGQKSRVVMAGLCLMRPHLILFDEPTNHLDIDSITALVKAVNNKELGIAFMIITHDPQLINRLNDVKLVVINTNTRRLYDYKGSMDDYKMEVLSKLTF